MSKRTLSDELQSVLLAHSFDAPEPSTSIDRVLARTVDAERQADAECQVDAERQADAERHADTEGQTDTDRRRWWPPPAKLLGVAAAIALVTLGAVGVKSLRDHTSTMSDSKAVPPAAGSANSGPGLTAPSQDAQASSGMKEASAGVKCGLQDLDITVSKEATGSAVIRFVNKTSNDCSIQGYPSVSAQRGQISSYALSAVPSAAAKPGGPSSIPALASPNVVLLPGGSASARVDVIKTDSCLQADRLTISLPGDASTYDLPFAIPMCGLRINPVVPGVTGSN